MFTAMSSGKQCGVKRKIPQRRQQRRQEEEEEEEKDDEEEERSWRDKQSVRREAMQPPGSVIEMGGYYDRPQKNAPRMLSSSLKHWEKNSSGAATITSASSADCGSSTTDDDDRDSCTTMDDDDTECDDTVYGNSDSEGRG